MSNEERANVVICGGGPAGLLAAILLDEAGVKSTVLERSTETDPWNTRSYTLVLGERGCGALERAGCLDRMREVGTARKFVFFYDGTTGDLKAIPKKVAGIGFSRSLLVESLEAIAVDLPNVSIQKGSGVSKVVASSDNNRGLVDVCLENDSIISATHIIAADGKWSRVRQSMPSLEAQATMEVCPSFGVAMVTSTVPEGWKTDGTYLIKPSSTDDQTLFYVIASPLPGDGLSISMVCYDETVDKYPWLAPPADKNTVDADAGEKVYTWEDDYSAKPAGEKQHLDLSDHLEALFQKEMPLFLAAIGKEALKSARINRRVTWLRMTPAESGNKEATTTTYATDDGRVALIGDSAHCMTPSLGEGCNTALESAVKLVDCVVSKMKENEETLCAVDTMSGAFVQYGVSRPKETQLIQEMSAARSTLKK